MISIRKEFEVDLAHRLTLHKGKCFNVHGHRYKIIVELTGDLNIAGMLVDFGELKWIKEWLDTNRDHAYVYNSADEVGIFLREKNYRTFEMGGEPTAENMAGYLYGEFKVKEPCISKVIVYETPSASTIYPS